MQRKKPMEHKRPLIVMLTEAQVGKLIQFDIESIEEKTQETYASVSKAGESQSFVTTLHMKDRRKIRVLAVCGLSMSGRSCAVESIVFDLRAQKGRSFVT